MRTWLEKIIGQRGQGIVEYALLLAFVVGCAAAVFSNNGLANGIKQTFTQVADVIGGGSHLPQIDESNYTDEEKEDKANMDDIASAIEKAIKHGDILVTDGYTAYLIVQKGTNPSFADWLAKRKVFTDRDKAMHLDGNLFDPYGTQSNGKTVAGVNWSEAGKKSVSWTPAEDSNIGMTDMWGFVGKYGSNGLSSQSVNSSTTGYYGVAIKSNGNNSYTTTYYKGSRDDYVNYRGIIASDAIGSVTWTK